MQCQLPRTASGTNTHLQRISCARHRSASCWTNGSITYCYANQSAETRTTGKRSPEGRPRGIEAENPWSRLCTSHVNWKIAECAYPYLCGTEKQRPCRKNVRSICEW